MSINYLSSLSKLFHRVLGIAIIIRIAFPSSGSTANKDLTNPIVNVAPVVGALSPDFYLLNLNQERIQLSDFVGKPVLLNFWATWCEPCRVEMPLIQNRYEKYSEEGLVVLTINAAEPQENVEVFKNELGLSFEFLLDPVADVQRLYRIQGYPTSVFVDSDGIIQVIHP